MNIEIANRLVQLRKEKNLSQEALASELGISRQAVSKWERAEASPDTDNLILLAKLYGMSLDELLKTDQEEFESGQTNDDTIDTDGIYAENEDGDFVHVSLSKGIHVKEKNGDEVHVSWNGIHVKSSDEEGEHKFNLGKEGVYVNGQKYDKDTLRKEWQNYYEFPISVLVCVTYIYIGIVYDAWHPGWLIFGIIPIFHSIVSAYKHRDIMYFCFPVLILMIVGYYGFVLDMWYPYWLLILTIPVFYSITGYIRHIIKRRKKNDEEL